MNEWVNIVCTDISINAHISLERTRAHEKYNKYVHTIYTHIVQ